MQRAAWLVHLRIAERDDELAVMPDAVGRRLIAPVLPLDLREIP